MRRFRRRNSGLKTDRSPVHDLNDVRIASPAGIAPVWPTGLSSFISGSRSFSRFSNQIAAVAVGWQIYDMTGSAFDLGMVGLVQFVPAAVSGVRRRPRRRPLRSQARAADLPDRARADGGLSRLGQLRRMADGAGDLRRARGVRRRHGLREPGRARRCCRAWRPRAWCKRAPRSRPACFRWRRSPVRRSAASPTRSRPALPTPSWRRSGWWPGILSGMIALQGPVEAKEPPTLARLVRRRGFRAAQSGDTRHHLAGSVRRAARRRHGAAADLCPRHPADRAMGPGRVARRAGRRRAADDRRARPPRRSTAGSACGCSRRSSCSASQPWCSRCRS